MIQFPIIGNSLGQIRELQKHKNIDLFCFDFTITLGNATYLENLFEIVKNLIKSLINRQMFTATKLELENQLTFLNYKLIELGNKLFISLIKSKSVFNALSKSLKPQMKCQF